MSQRSKVLARIPRPTTKSYQEAVREIILAVQGDLTDAELADRLGCSVGTVRNARDKNGCLNGVTLANIEREFGPSALDPFLALGGSRAVPIGSICNTDGDFALVLLAALQVVIEAQQPDSDGGIEVTTHEMRPHVAVLRDARTAIDALIAIAERPNARAVA
jgi:hypothetical protein